MIDFTVRHESWPIDGGFAISRGRKTAADVVVVTLTDCTAAHRGMGEAVPYPRYGETVESVIAQLEEIRPLVEQGLGENFSHHTLQKCLPPGAARNAIDCAMWDLAAAQASRAVWQLADLPPPQAATTAFTISLDEPDQMASAAAKAAEFPLLKIKLGAAGGVDADLARLEAVRAACPGHRLIADVNEGWSAEDLIAAGPELKRLGIAMVEQPLPAAEDFALDHIDCPVPLCADESCHGETLAPEISRRYDIVNIKLDKTGGLTGALTLLHAARRAELGIMLGCMVSTSLAIAPALMLAGAAATIDLDGPMLLTRDRQPGLNWQNAVIYPPGPELWGGTAS